ncbi:MAG: putative cytochrome ubiquinol oxidase chain cyoD [Candidatus Saccharibacteria bacterium]|nr:putative cytochrome ubiquinol oxidase chain cyoD [Candidatus Saccharibacteria bacterium]
MSNHQHASLESEAGLGSYTAYTTGFILSLILTIGAYLAVTENLLSGNILVTAVIGLAILQLFVQMFFFLHLGRESKPRWNLVAFIFMVMVVFIVVIGSLWIMNNLDYHNHLTPSEQDSYMHTRNNEGF